MIKIGGDQVAYQVAKKAAALQMRQAAKYRVEVQNGWKPGSGPSYEVLADRAEAAAREWLEKARRAKGYTPEPEYPEVHDPDPHRHALEVWKSLIDEIGD
jgi:hypothetical protein